MLQKKKEKYITYVVARKNQQACGKIKTLSE
jgi:hypothetical protein